MAEIIEFPFDSGAYEAADREWLPPNLLAVVENMRLDLDGRLGVRPGNTALGTTTYSAGSLVAYDLANYSGRLVALGDQTAAGRPTDLFEFVNNKAAWRGTAGSDAGTFTGPRLMRATAVRETGRIPDLAFDTRHVALAASSNLICEVIGLFNSTARIHIFDPRTDQTIFLTTIAAFAMPRVVFAGTKFWIVGQDMGDLDLKAYNFDPSADETLTGPTTLVALAASVNDLALAQTGASDFTLAYVPNAGTTVEAVRYNSSGVAQSTFTAASGATNIGAVAVCGNSGGTRLTFAWQDGAAYKLQTRTQTGGAVIGPTSLFGGAGTVAWKRLGMVQAGTVISICGMQDSGPTYDTVMQTCVNESTHSLSGTSVYADAFLMAGPTAIGSDFFLGVVDALAAISGEATNQLVEQLTKLPQSLKDSTLAGWDLLLDASNAISGMAAVGTKLYWGNKVKSIVPRDAAEVIPSGSSATVTEVETADTGRRQMTQLANELHIAGALPMVYDGRYLFEHGFAEKPVVALAAGTTGSIPNGTFFVQTVWEVVDSRGNILRSAVSDPQQITLTGANDSITATASTPHSLRRHPLLQAQGGVTIRVGFYRTIAGGANFHIEQYAAISASDAFGAPISVVLSLSDAALADNAVVYTQSQTPVAHVSPPPYRYSWAGRERQLAGGLPSAEQWTFSKLLFPSEPVEFAPSGRLGFSGRANQDITAVGAFENVGLVWTKSEVSIIPGRGPEHNGTGEFDSPIRVPSPGGCQDWRSVVDAPPGFFFQMAPDKLMLLPRSAQSAGGAGEVTWAGQPIRQTLALFPIITGACHVRSQMIVAFSCTNVAGDAGRILIYDLRRDVWFVDTVGPVVAVSELDGRLAFILSGGVFLQDATAGVGAMPTCTAQTGVLPITKRLGWGHIYKVGLLGLDSGACSVEAFINYDDGAGFRSLGTETFTGTGLTVEKFWSLAIQKTSRFSLRFVMTGASGTLGLRLNAWALEVEGSKNMVRVGSGGNVN